MDFVDGNGRFEPVFLRAAREPAGVLPFVVIEAGDDGARIGAQLGAEGVGIGFEGENVAAGADDFIFVDGAFAELGEENLPEAGGATSAHGMDAAIPAIEIAHDADALGAGGPNGEVNAADAFQGDHMSAQFFVSVVVAAFAHEIQIKLAKYDGKGIGIEDLEGIAGVGSSLNLVTAWGGRSGLLRRPTGLEETLGAKFHGVGDFRGGECSAFNGGRFQGDAGFRGPGQEKAYRPVAVNLMRTEEGEGVGVASSKDGIDLRVEARIAWDNRCRVLHGWSLLRQVSDLRKVANGGLADKLSPNADLRPLNSRALAGKCNQKRGWLK